ncbi:MAG: c-type cytochrome [Planctomycetaceae bacterium]|nr:c-type cytochrome [Planctomycetaceae bacterium]
MQNPIGIAWDDQGRMWVAENYTYAERSQRFDLSLRDRVLILEDKDRDGRAETRRVFTDNVQMLTSVETGHGGVWLMCPPQLLFIPDADGDDQPDGPPQVMLDGFTVAQDNYHNFANGLRWGPDGWLYGRCGHSCPGRLGIPGTPDDQRIPIEGGIWRFHPSRHTVEVLCHGTVNPWGHDWDANGQLFFINTVIGHLWHGMPGAHFRESFGESVNSAVYERLDMIADHYHFDTRGAWSESRDGKANDFGGGHAHCGMTILQHPRWPEEFRNRLITLNMHGRRANRERLEREGAGYVGRHESDLLISSDPFFRGIEVQEGPDGALYVVDWSDIGECHEQTGVHRTSGRIYRVTTAEHRSDSLRLLKPGCLNNDGRLPQLWIRYQAGKVSREELLELSHNDDEHLRVWAIRLLTDFWPMDTVAGRLPQFRTPPDDVVLTRFNSMAKQDSSGLVLLTLASTLQRLNRPDRFELASALLQRGEFQHDRDLPSLIWYGLIPAAQQNPQHLASIVAGCEFPTTLRWITRFLAAHSADESQPLNQLLQTATALSADCQENALLGMRDAWRGWRKAAQPATWPEFHLTAGARRQPDIVLELSSLFGDGRAMEEIRALVTDGRADFRSRQHALEVLIETRPDDLRAICESLIRSRPLNATAARGLALFDDPAVARLLAENFRRFQPEDRNAVVEILTSRVTFARELLNHLTAGNRQLEPADLTAFHARQIRSLNDQTLTEQLSRVWGQLRDSPAERLQQMKELRESLTNSRASKNQGDLPNLVAGRQLFRRTCSQCHTLYGDGRQVGPDLTGAQRQNLDYLLQNIVDPGAVVGAAYRLSVIQTNDGRVLNGLVLSRDEQRLVLQTATEQLVVSADEIEEVRLTELSSMPDGLLTGLSPEQIRDLFGYLMHSSQVHLPEER